MKHSIVDFNKISQVLTDTIEVIKDEQDLATSALEDLENAKSELQQAMSYSMSSLHK